MDCKVQYSGGFSVNLFWPTSAPEKVNVQSKKKRKRKRKPKAKNSLVALSSSSLRVNQQPTALIESQSTEKSDLDAQCDAQNKEISSVHTASSPIRPVDVRESPSHCNSTHPGTPSPKTILNLETCTEVQYESRDGVHGVSYNDAEEGE